MIKTLYQATDGQLFNTFGEAMQHEIILEGDEYEVELHFTGYYTTVVRAHNKKEAFEKANKEWKLEDLNIDISEQYITKID